MEQHATTARYAVLIGIDAYPENPLRGCVSDVTEMKKHIERKFPAANIRAFTASPSGNSNPTGLVEKPEFWPTHHNVISSFNWVQSAAKPGDSIYIHFSGHGVNCYPRSDSHVSDLALVLLEVRKNVAIRYLRGVELAWMLNNMVKKGLMVTLVLDCCESGSVMRSDSAVRSIRYDPNVDAAYPIQANIMPHCDNGTTTSIHRAASMRPNWLVDPNGYTILTACGPTEQAKEIELRHNGKKYGALSYFLINAFARLEGVEVKSQHMYYHLCARFRETRHMRQNEQNPMFYGNRNLSFFGDDETETDRVAIPVLRMADQRLQLEAGKAHGVCSGDRFAICPLGHSSAATATSTSTVLATVTIVEPLISYLDIKDTRSLILSSRWIATPLTYFSLKQFPVKLDINLPIPAEWANAFRENESLVMYNTQSEGPITPWSFHVAPAINHSYEVRDEMTQDTFRVPKAHGNKLSTGHNVLDLVEHLARFRFVQMLTNKSLVDPDHFFSSSFTVELLDSFQRSHRPGCLKRDMTSQFCLHTGCATDVKDSELVTLVIKSTGRPRFGDTYVHLYDMDSGWAIENILRANHAVITRNQVTWRQYVQLTIPDKSKETGQRYYEDTIKVFLTSSPTSFMSLELPELATRAVRGQRVQTSRASASLSDEWAVYNFRVRIHVT